MLTQAESVQSSIGGKGTWKGVDVDTIDNGASRNRRTLFPALIEPNNIELSSTLHADIMMKMLSKSHRGLTVSLALRDGDWQSESEALHSEFSKLLEERLGSTSLFGAPLATLLAMSEPRNLSF